MAIEVVFQTPDTNYSDTLDMLEDGRADDARRGRLAKSVARNALYSLKCATHLTQDLYVIVLFEKNGVIRTYVKGCCDSATSEAQRLLDVDVNPDDADWRRHL